jgi:hypothetical protein
MLLGLLKMLLLMVSHPFGLDRCGRRADDIAKENKFDVVLIDTAGRMQDNEPLMRALAKVSLCFSRSPIFPPHFTMFPHIQIPIHAGRPLVPAPHSHSLTPTFTILSVA